MPLDMFIPPVADAWALAIGVFQHIPREASARLLVLLRWAVPGPQQAEWANSTAHTLFCFIAIEEKLMALISAICVLQIF